MTKDRRRKHHQPRPDSARLEPTPQMPQIKPIQLKKYNLFWILAAFLSIALVAIMVQNIKEPFIEMHSWGHAHDAWVARSNVVYGLSYTKGFDTFAVGNPPPEKPTRYLDHPVLFTLINSAAMCILGVNVWTLRVMNIISTIAALLIFLKILRHLVDDVTALLAGLFFCLFPLIAFFGVNMWLYPLVFLAFWCYLALTGTLKDVAIKKWHKPALAIAIFLAIQMTWEGFFFAMALGIHYVFWCIKRKRLPDWPLLSILTIVPFASLALDFTILAAGHNWDFKRLIELAKIRTTSGERGQLTWSEWFGRFLEHALTNFSLPVLIAAALNLTVGQLYARKNKTGSPYSLRYPQFWLFLMPALFQLTLLRGTLWPHQYWERPMAPLLAVATAGAITIIFDILKKLNLVLSLVVSSALTILLCWGCFYGIQYYYGIRWENPQRIEMFEDLNGKIPPDKYLLSFDPFTVDQFPGVKAASYRPEIAWHLNREITEAGQNFIAVDSQGNLSVNIPALLTEIDNKAKTAKFPYYIVPFVYTMYNPVRRGQSAVVNMQQLIEKLAARYKIDSRYEFVEWQPRKVPWLETVPVFKKWMPWSAGELFFQRGTMPYIIFDLRSSPTQ